MGAELWLGESDDVAVHRQLFSNATAVGSALAALGQKWNLTGFNMDLEAAKGSTHDDAVKFVQSSTLFHRSLPAPSLAPTRRT